LFQLKKELEAKAARKGRAISKRELAEAMKKKGLVAKRKTFDDDDEGEV